MTLGLRIQIPVVALLVLLSVARAEEGGAWATLFVREGITVSRQHVEGSSFYAGRATGKLAARFAKLVTVIRDVPNKTAWVRMLKEARLVRETPSERIEYYYFKTPAFTRDRDLVVRTTFTIEPQNRRVIFTAQSVEDPECPERPGVVRARLVSGRITLTPADQGGATLIDSEAHLEPRGQVPGWLFNLIQKTAPKQSLEDLLKRLAKEPVPDYPGLDFAGG
jgi:hypothetical protein